MADLRAKAEENKADLAALMIDVYKRQHFICATLNTAVRMSFAIAADAQKSTTAKVIKNLLVFIVSLLI